MKNILIFLIISVSFMSLELIWTRECYGQRRNLPFTESDFVSNIIKCKEGDINACKELLKQLEILKGGAPTQQKVNEFEEWQDRISERIQMLKKKNSGFYGKPRVVITEVYTTKKGSKTEKRQFEPNASISCHIDYTISGIEGYPPKVVVCQVDAYIEGPGDPGYQYQVWPKKYWAEVGENWSILLFTSAPKDPGRYTFKARARLVNSRTGSQIGAETLWKEAYFYVKGRPRIIVLKRSGNIRIDISRLPKISWSAPVRTVRVEARSTGKGVTSWWQIGVESGYRSLTPPITINKVPFNATKKLWSEHISFVASQRGIYNITVWGVDWDKTKSSGFVSFSIK